jgi:hypothetical protein
MADLNIYPPSAPVDSWSRFSFHLTIQDCITTEWFNPVRRVITFEDGRFWKTEQSRYKVKIAVDHFLVSCDPFRKIVRGKATAKLYESLDHFTEFSTLRELFHFI